MCRLDFVAKYEKYPFKLLIPAREGGGNAYNFFRILPFWMKVCTEQC